jgi:DNA-binding transcriptional LysR family regulator
MPITLEQAKTLDAVARTGSISKAAAELHKVHTAVLYNLKTLEDETGLILLDRSGYRTQLTPVGIRYWQELKRLLLLEEDIHKLASHLKTGAEPELKIVYDGLLPSEAVLIAIQKVKQKFPDTRIEAYSEYLAQTEKMFFEMKADILLSVVPSKNENLTQKNLKSLPAFLVAHQKHPLILKQAKNKLSVQDLREHTFLTVRGSDIRLDLSTLSLESSSTIHLSDFHAKKLALRKMMGYGWMPEYMIQQEIKNQTFCLVEWEGHNVHKFQPRLCYLSSSHNQAPLGPAAKLFIATLMQF